jgi:hypothetical protein
VGQVRIGIAIGRRAARIVIVRGDRNTCVMLFEREIARPPVAPPSLILGELLSDVPKPFRKESLAVALSSADLACDDIWEAPDGLRTKDVAAVAPVLLEARSTGESLEHLSIDVRAGAGQLTAVALVTRELLALREKAGVHGGRLRLVTSIPAAVSETYLRQGSYSLCWAGQRVEVERREENVAWRSMPWDRAEEVSAAPLEIGGLSLGPGTAAAMAVALADPDAVPNALRGAPDAPRSFGERFRIPLWAFSIASALFLVALGFFFRAENARLGFELAAAEQTERRLTLLHFPERLPVRGDLVRMVKDRLRDSGQGAAGDTPVPSAFRFWLELGKHLPDVESLGLSLESLDISPEGGRLSAAVASAPGDALRNAALLEAKLNESAKLSARGDFEARERDVQVRLKMDYRSR